MTNYQCPLCGNTMARDLVLFLDHTNQHVIDKIKQSHPEWIAENGACKPCVDYYQTQISGENINIGPRERQKRVVLGIVALIFSAAAGFYLIGSQSPRILRLGLFVPLFFGMFGLIQAREKTCSVLAEIGSQNLDAGVQKIENASIIEGLKHKGRQILLKSAFAAGLITAILFFLPGNTA